MKERTGISKFLYEMSARHERRKLAREKKEAEKSRAQVFWESVATIAIAALLALLCKKYVGQPIFVSGNSMNDTLQNKNFVWSNKIAYTPERFDVVIIRPQIGDAKLLIKRVIALPGEKVYIDTDDKIHITPKDGAEYVLDDPYGYFEGPVYSKLILKATNPDGSITLGDDEYFCMGDNRYNSADSRSYGAFSRSHIDGHAVIRLWPITKFGNFDKDNK